MEYEHFEAKYPAATRFVEIAKIVGFIKEGNSSQLVGVPGVGRSTVLGLLSFNRDVRTKHFGQDQDKVHFVPVNFAEIRNRPLIDATKLIFLSLADSLKARNMEEAYAVVRLHFKESLELQDELVLLQGLKHALDYLTLEKELTVVMLFDRFEQYVPMVTPDFFAHLRSLRDRAKFRFSVVFSLSRPLDMLLDPSLFADFFEFVAGHTVFMRLHDPDGLSYRLQFLEEATGKKLGKGIQDTVVEVTAGHSKLTKVAVEALLANNASPEDLSAYLLGLRSVRGALGEIWLGLTPYEQKLVTKSLSTDEEDEAEVRYLSSIGLFEKGTVKIPLFASYLAQEQAQILAVHEQLRYDEATNTIRKGEVVVSDQLTSSEFRLLRYLLQNTEAVIDRNQVIDVVWQESKTTAGVTDQAVDQLVFRLRRKIEEDPNNPKHLQTVKGRGFKFVA